VTGTFRALAGRLRHELTALDRVAARARSAMADARDGDDRFVDAAALNLHAFYSGVERLLESVARNVDGSRPEGPNWHSDLLAQVAAPIADTRPAVISEDLRHRLDRYRGFRHVVRNVYTYNLDAAQVALLVDDLEDTQRRLAAELGTFADFLDAAAG